jgi:hypothetical protein
MTRGSGDSGGGAKAPLIASYKMDRIITFPETTLPLFLWKPVVNWRSRRDAARRGAARVHSVSRKQARRVLKAKQL